MQVETLTAALKHPDAAVRVDVARVLGLVEETRALDALREHFAVETEPTVREALQWAGQRIFAAQQAGYSTIEALFEHFNINREIASTPDETEAELLKKMDSMLDKDLRRMKEKAAKGRAGTALIAGVGGMMVGGAIAGMSMMSMALAPGADVAESSLSGGIPAAARRTPPTAPSTVDVTIRVRRLRDDPSPGNRELAAAELAQLNNPLALPHLAAAYLYDPVPQVRQVAERFGKILYWTALYWDMEQRGEIAAEMTRRRSARGTSTSSAPATPTALPPAPQQDIGDILRKAQENRAKRNKKL